MSKLKTELIDKIYKTNFICNKGHPVYWKGSEFIQYFSPNKICDKCGKQTTCEIPIRWCCDECGFFICSKCYKVIIDKYCPKKHKYKFIKSDNLYNTFTCDNCFGKFAHKDGLLMDEDCNVTFCLNCYYDCTDIPDILED